jgi:hypothetical protein
MSAGEFFDLIRPAVLIVSALLSTWVLVHARRHGLPLVWSFTWALAAVALPLVAVPIYLAIRLIRKQPKTDPVKRALWATFLLPSIYLMFLLALIAIWEYRAANAVDLHLARATQAKLAGDRPRVISEYRAALAIKDDPHTRKLLGVELSDEGDWTAAFSELRLAERGGEPDGSLPFRIARLLDALNQPNQALMEYKRFIYSEACLKHMMDAECDVARQRVEGAGYPGE